MKTISKTILLACATALLAFALAACGSSGQAESGASAGSASASSDSAAQASREDVEPILLKAAEQPFSTVTFETETETTATGPDDKGAMQTHSAITSLDGELDRSGDKPKMHMKHESMSTVELGRTEYDLFIDSESFIIKQGDELFTDQMTDEILDSYVDAATGAITVKEITEALDAAVNYKLAENNGETTVTVTIDPAKLSKTQAEDESPLPEGADITTMVASYTIDAEGRFKSVRIMTSTTGTPTYRTHQTCLYSGYDSTTLPEWPDLQAYVLEQSGIKTDENGNMYFEGEDGQIYYVTEITDDGTIYYTN